MAQADEPGRVLAIDDGKARVGLALSDETRVLATPHAVLPGQDRKRLVREIASLCERYEVKRVLVGLPLHMSGEAGKGAGRARELAQAVADATGLEVELVDERWSTVEAERKRRVAHEGSRRSSVAIDAAAAAVVLQAWLDARASTAR